MKKSNRIELLPEQSLCDCEEVEDFDYDEFIGFSGVDLEGLFSDSEKLKAGLDSMINAPNLLSELFDLVK